MHTRSGKHKCTHEVAHINAHSKWHKYMHARRGNNKCTHEVADINAHTKWQTQMHRRSGKNKCTDSHPSPQRPPKWRPFRGCPLGGNFHFFKDRKSVILGVWAAPGAPEALPKVGGSSPPTFRIILQVGPVGTGLAVKFGQNWALNRKRKCTC